MGGDLKVRFVKDIGEYPETSAPGDVEWIVHESSPYPGHEAGLLFMCPCGCGSLGCLMVILQDRHPQWTWNGDVVRPTLTPSVRKTSECGWHGTLTVGVWHKAG